MTNMDIEVTSEKILTVGSYGFRLIVNCMVSFDPDVLPLIIIKNKSCVVITRTAAFQSAESGVVEYRFVPGDLTEAGTYEFQIKQIGPSNSYVFMSPIFQLPVYPSLDGSTGVSSSSSG